MGSHAQQRADGHHAGTADAGHQNAVGRRGRCERWLRQRGKFSGRHLLRFAQIAADHRHEARAKTVDAGKILVAGALIDGALASEFGFHRRDGNAIRLHAAVAAALAHQLVDDHPLGGIGILAALAPAALFRGAGLIVEQNGDTRRITQGSLHAVEIVAVVDLDVGREITGRIFFRLVGDDNDFFHALGGDLARDIRRRKRSVDRLAAGHCHRIVVEDLVGDVDVGGDRRPDGEAARVVVRSVAQVGEDVFFVGELRLPDPWHAFAAHVGEGRRRAVHPDRHHVTTDARGRAAAFGNFRRRVVRASRAEIRNALQADLGFGQRRFLGVDEGHSAAHLFHGARMQVQPLDALRDDARDHRRRELGRRGQQPVAVRAHPFALFVKLADHSRTHVGPPVVELLLQLVLDDLPLFLDYQDFFQAFGEVADTLGLERPRHGHLEQTNADLCRVGLGDAQIVERLTYVHIALAAGDDAQPRLGRVDDDAVQLIGATVMQRRVNLVTVHPRFGVEESVGPADRNAVRRKWKVVGRDQLDAVGIDIDRGRAFDGVGHALESDPQAGVAAHCPAVQAEIDDFLHRRGIQHRHHGGRELVVGLMREGRRFRRGAREIGMLEHVAAAVHTGALAVPHREHAVVLGARVHVDLLAAPDRGRSQVLVQSRPKLDVRLGKKFFRTPQRKVERAQRRAAIAGDEAGGVQPGQHVALALQHQQAHQRLNAGHINAAGLELIFVVESDIAQRVRTAGRRGHRTSSKNFVSGLRGHRVRAATTRPPIVSAARYEARILRFRPRCGKCVAGLPKRRARLPSNGAGRRHKTLESTWIALIVRLWQSRGRC